MTKNFTTPHADVGIIIGRFQVHELHEAHTNLIDTVKSKHDKVLIFLGLSPLRNTINNPLDFKARKRMFQETYPEIDVYYAHDNPSDQVWSKNLDREIERWINPHQTVLLYGSRDSFISHYSGKYPTCELDSQMRISGTEIRRRITNSFIPTKEFRAGVISASFDRFPTCYAAVDIAIINRTNNTILLGKKSHDNDAFRFIGGFSDPSSASFEIDAKREVEEETGVEIDGIKYIGSAIVADWRYRSEIDKVKTLFFEATYIFGKAEANDDIALVAWVPLEDLVNGKIKMIPEHVPLVEMYKNYITKKV